MRQNHPTYKAMVTKALFERPRHPARAAALATELRYTFGLTTKGFRLHTKKILHQGLEEGWLKKNERHQYSLSRNARRRLSRFAPTSTAAFARLVEGRRKARKLKQRAQKKSMAAQRRAAKRQAWSDDDDSSSSDESVELEFGDLYDKDIREQDRHATHFWQYQHNGWQPYDGNASLLVERAFQEFQGNPGRCDVRSVRSGYFAYQVNFLGMKQTNIEHPSHTVRGIRRVPISA